MQTEIPSITPDPLQTPANSGFTEPSSPNEAQALAQSILEEENKSLNDYTYAKIYLNQLVSQWRSSEEQRTEANRLTRDIDVDIDVLRNSGDIEEDECFIPERIIDSNIQRELPSYINFLKNSRRIATFTDQLDETFDTDRVEQAFTKGMTYKGWTKPHFKVLDSALTHGWASAEVVYDTKYPLHCGIEYIAHEDLIFPFDCKEIQACSVILRRYRVTPLQLKTWVAKFGFDLVQVNAIIEKYKENRNKDSTLPIYKRFCKHQGVVYTSWFSIEGACTDWLKKPAKHYAGIDSMQTVVNNVPQQVPQYDPATGAVIGVSTQMVPTPSQEWVAQDLENYPIFVLPYRETEKPYQFDHIGRVYLDKDKQEAQTAIITAFINRLNRSQKVYASPSTDYVNDGKPAKQLANIKWIDGTIFDKPMAFWQMPPPDPVVLKALEYMDVSNSQDIGQTDFAALNRQDSRKTAREITAAEKAQLLLDSVDLTLYSEFIREVYAFAWVIVRSQALQNKIKFLLVSPQEAQGAEMPPNAIPMQQGGQAPMMPPQQQMQQNPNQSIVNSLGSYQQETSAYVNDYDTIVRYYDIRAAGDVDVIQKQELEQQMMQDWPVIQNTPLAGRFLADLIKLKYPQDGAIYSDILLSGNPKNQVIQALGSALAGIVKMPEVAQHITPQVQKGLQQLQQESLQALQAP